MYDQINAQQGTQILDQQLNKRLGFRSFGQTTIFLSYGSHDTDVVRQVASSLYQLGFDLYIDWIEDATSFNSKKIKDKIKGLDKFILIATPDTISATLNNWQLGFADAYKFPDRLAVLPIAEPHQTWQSYSHFEGYPHLSFDESIDKYERKKSNAWVLYPDGIRVSFEQWLRK